MATMHFGMVSVIGLSRLPTPAASRKAFTCPPSGPRRERASARWPRPARRRGRPCPQAMRRTPRPTRCGVRRGSQPRPRRALMSERMWRVSPNRYSPVTTPGWSDPYWRLTMSANSLVVTALPPPTLKTRPAARSSVKHEHVGVHHVVDVDVVADRPAVLVEGRRLAQQVAQAEDAARAGVGVVDRLPRTLDDAVAERDGGDAVPAARG